MTAPLLRTLALATLPTAAAAHDGHGLTGSHWHATDAWGFLAVGVLLAIGIWWSRRK